ncbi:hypothetical protein JCM1393_25370 [Clostridium carnis]
MKKYKKIISSILVLSMILSINTSLVQAATNEEYNISDITTFDDGTLILGEKEVEVLLLIENMPDDIIESGAYSVNKYFAENGRPDLTVSDTVRSKRGVVGCVSAIGIAVLVNFTPAKLAKVKSVLKAVGGATKFVNKTVGLYNKFKAAKGKLAAAKAAVSGAAAGVSGRDILLELFSLGGVYSACFE